jgi:alpha-tubulin suppressor-like RCC1 family protein
MKMKYLLPVVAALNGVFAAGKPACAQEWTPTSAPTRNWQAIDSSADGTKLVAAALDGQICLSRNSGASWVQTTVPATTLLSVASSADGSKLVVTSNDGIYTSVNSGASWVLTSAPIYAGWYSVCCSADGTKLVAVGLGGIYTSVNSGASWTLTSAPANQEWQSVTCSGDGIKLAAAVWGGPIYISTDAGATWKASGAPTSLWAAVKSSADGTQLVGASLSDGIYTSTNSGATWIPTLAGSFEDLPSIGSSADGSKWVVVSGTSQTQGGIFTSADSGTTWWYGGYGSWTAVASSSDGTKWVAAVSGGGIYTWDPTRPVIANQPASLTVLAGDNVAIRVGVFGVTPLAYQWSFDGTNLLNATQAELTFTNVSLSDSGLYSVVVSNSFGSLLSSNALLTVLPEVITTQPQPVNQTVLAGSDITFAVAVSSTASMAYQWELNGTNLPGATNSTIVLTNVTHDSSGTYAALVSNTFGSVLSSNAVFVVTPAFVTTEPADGLSATGAVLHGLFTAEAPDSVVWFEWGIDTNYGDAVGSSILPGSSNAVAISSTLSGLTGDFIYHYRLVAWNIFGLVYGEDQQFALSTAPAATTLAATSVTTNSAMLNGIVNPDYAPTTAYFEWGPTRGYGNVTPATGLGNGTVSLTLSNPLTNLAAGTLCHYRVVASNIVGVAVGGDASFRVPGAPLATTQPANAISTNGATLNGMATPNHFLTTTWFEWGTNTSYGHLAGITNISGGDSVMAIRTALAGLSRDPVYHCRLVASNMFGVIFGADQQFALGRNVFAWGADSQTYFPFGTNQDVVAIAAGANETMALKVDSTALKPLFYLGSYVIYGMAIVGSNVVAIAANNGSFYYYDWGTGYGDTYFINHSLALQSDGSVTALSEGDSLYGLGYVPAGVSNVVAIATGAFHNLVLQSDGQVVAWGAGMDQFQNFPDVGQSVVPDGLSNVVAIAAGGTHSIALKNDGTVISWGNNYAPDDLSNVVAVATGENHSLALRSDGTVVIWGDETSVPPGLSNVVAIAAGGDHSLALRSDGTVVNWGDETSVPDGLSNSVVAIAAGQGLSLALTPRTPPLATTLAATSLTPNAATLNATINPEAAKATVCFQWGTTTSYGNVTAATDMGNGSATLNFNNLLTGLTPNTAYHCEVVVSNGLGLFVGGDISFITAGPPFATTHPANAISANGAVLNGMVTPGGIDTVAWFEWGTDTAYGEAAGATLVADGHNVVAVNSGLTGLSANNIYHYRLVAWNASGITYGADQQFTLGRGVFAWGANYFGQTSVPPYLTNAVAVAAGDNFSLALRTDGAVVAWGVQYWSGGFVPMVVPTEWSNVVAIAAGGSQGLALRSDGTVFSWGARIGGMSNVVAVAVSGSETLALKADGTVFGWGTWATAGLSNIVAIAAGGVTNSLALKNDGTVVGFGEYTPEYSIAGLSNVVAIAAGYYHGLALKNDGTVVAWGDDNYYGQTNVPAGLNNVIAIAAGDFHSLALKRDGTVVAWGAGMNNTVNLESYAQSLVPPALTKVVVGIAAGGYHSLVLTPRTAPAATTLSATGVPTNSTTLNAIVNPNDADTTAWFEWGTTTNYGRLTPATALGNGSASLSFNGLVLGLASNTVYHCQVVASNRLRTVFGGDAIFMLGVPLAVTEPATAVTSAHAALNGAITPNLLPTSAWFEWGTNADYGNTILLGDLGSGSATLSVSSLLNGLSASVVYHCRLVASNSAGVSFGADQAFDEALYTHANSVIADQPLVYYRFDEAAGSTALNEGTLGSAGDGSYNSNVSLGNPSILPSFGSAAGFNNTNSGVAVPALGSYSQLTLEAWVKPRSLATTPFVYDWTCDYDAIYARDVWVPGSLHFQFYSADPATHYLALSVNGNDPNEVFTSVLTRFLTNQWVHVAVTYDSTARKMVAYINGQSVMTNVFYTALPANLDAAHIGQFLAGDPEHHAFDGLIDEFALYGSVLPADRLRAHYQTAIGSPVLAFAPGTKQLIFSWVGPGFALQQNDHLANSAGWTYVTGGSNSPTSLSISGTENQFFRLKKP